jgi:hypothetical protein
MFPQDGASPLLFAGSHSHSFTALASIMCPSLILNRTGNICRNHSSVRVGCGVIRRWLRLRVIWCYMGWGATEV